jgi:outer membrane lipoprotein-sorting protein
MKRVFIALMAAAHTGATPAHAQSYKPIRFEMQAYVKTDNQMRSEISRVWFHGPNKFRIEQEAGAQKIITIANGADVWEVRTLNNVVFHSKEKPEKVAKVGKQTYGPVNTLASFLKQGGKKVGTATIDGAACAVYRRTEKTGLTYKLWVQPNGRVRRMQSSGTLRGAISMGAPIETHTVEQRVDFKWPPPEKMDESLFRPPAGAAVTERAASK